MKILAIAAAMLATQAVAAPSVFVGEDSNYAWYISKARARPMGKQIDAVSLSALNLYRQENFPAFQPLCYVDALDRGSFVGTDRKTQLAIDATFRATLHDPFRQKFSTSDGRHFIAQVGLGEECDTGTLVSTIIVYEAQTRAIENVLEWSETPFRFLWPGEQQALIFHSSCFECGDSNALFYDAGRRKFYWESLGD
jgi:hypothetical protein